MCSSDLAAEMESLGQVFRLFQDKASHQIHVIYRRSDETYGILQPVMLGNYFGRQSFATIQGGVRPFMALPSLAIPLVIAGLADYTGHFTAGFIFCGCIGLVGAACSFFAGAPTKRRPATGSAAGT